MPDLVGKFEKLPPESKQVFALFLMYGLPVNITAFLKAVSFAGLKTPQTGRYLTASHVGNIFGELKEIGLVDGDSGYPWHVTKDAQEIFGHRFVQDNFGKWVYGIEQRHERELAKYSLEPWRHYNLSDEHKAALILQPLRLIINNRGLSEKDRTRFFQEKLHGVMSDGCFWPRIMQLADRPLAIWRMLGEEQRVIAFESLKVLVLEFAEPIDTVLEIAGRYRPEADRQRLGQQHSWSAEIS